MTTLSSRETAPFYLLVSGVAIVIDEDHNRPEIEILMYDGSSLRVDFELVQEFAQMGKGLLIDHGLPKQS